MNEMKNKITQHIPGFADCGQDRIESEFNTLDELLNIDFVKSFREYPWTDKTPFYQYSLSNNYLMAEWRNENNHHWLVIGYLENIDTIDLPEISFGEDKFIPPYKIYKESR